MINEHIIYIDKRGNVYLFYVTNINLLSPLKTFTAILKLVRNNQQKNYCGEKKSQKKRTPFTTGVDQCLLQKAYSFNRTNALQMQSTTNFFSCK